MGKALSVEDVVLGEAKAGDFADMLGIASVVENRSRALQVSPEQVVGVKAEFNAYGKALPPGVEQYRDMARRAIDQVRTLGPVHNATFYATEKAAKNLPSGLKLETTTGGHQYFSDPQNRSIRTTEGFKTPDPSYAQTTNIAGQPSNTLYDVAPAQSTASAQAGILAGANATMGRAPGLAGIVSPQSMAAAANAANPRLGQSTIGPSPTPKSVDLEDRRMSPVLGVGAYNPGAARSQMPSSGIVNDIQQAVTNRFGPGFSVGIYSGQEPAGSRAVGSQKNHPSGRAADFDVVDPSGRPLDMSSPRDAAAMREVHKDLAAKGHAIGYGGGYMAPGRTHAGSPPGSPVVGWGADLTRASMDRGLYADLAQAKQSGVNLPSVGPMPASRPSPGMERRGLLSPEYTAPAPAVERAQLPSVEQRQMQTMAQQYGSYRPGVVSQKPSFTATAATAPAAATAAAQFAPVAPPAPPPSVPVPTPRQIAPPPPPQVIAPPPQPVAPSISRNVAPPAPRPSSATGLDVWSGRATEGFATNGNQMTRNPDGTVSMTSSKYGYTETMNPDGSYRSTNAPGIMGAFGRQQGATPSQPGSNIPGPGNRGFNLGPGAKAMAGSVAGSMIGGAFLGPLGGILGGVVGRNMAQGKGILGNTKRDSFGWAMPSVAQALSAYSRGYTPGLGFPGAPSAPANPGTGNLTGFGEAAARGEYGQQAKDAANNPGRGLY